MGYLLILDPFPAKKWQECILKGYARNLNEAIQEWLVRSNQQHDNCVRIRTIWYINSSYLLSKPGIGKCTEPGRPLWADLAICEFQIYYSAILTSKIEGISWCTRVGKFLLLEACLPVWGSTISSNKFAFWKQLAVVFFAISSVPINCILLLFGKLDIFDKISTSSWNS